MQLCLSLLRQIKSIKVQTLSAVALHAATACTEDEAGVLLASFGYSQEAVICLVLHVSGSRYACIYVRLQV